MAKEISSRLPMLTPQRNTQAASVQVLRTEEPTTVVDKSAHDDSVQDHFIEESVATADLSRKGAELAAVALQNARLASVAGVHLGAAMEGVEKVMKGAGPFLAKLAVGVAGMSATQNSLASSTSGKYWEGALATGGTALLIGAVSEPIVMTDMALNLVGEKVLDPVFGKGTTEKFGGWIAGHAVTTPARLAVAYGEAIFNGNMVGLNTFAADARAGKLGAAYQQALSVGDRLSGTLVNGFERAASFFKRP